MGTTGPLSGLLVADFSRVLAGPFAAMMLADLGARVIKVERPGAGDDSRGYGPFVDGRSLYFARVNRGKESIALDLKDPADLEVARRLIRRADVLVENYRPGVMDRLGLGWPDAQALNPRLVYCSVSGFGHTGPWRERPAYDAVVQGLSGIMAVTGSADGPPVKPGVPIADLSAGLYAFGGITSALLGREQTGLGTHVDIAMYDATISLLEGAALSWLATGREPGRIGNAHFAIAPFDTFTCADRDITVCAANDVLFGVLVTALGVPRLATDERFGSNALRHDNRDVLKTELEAVLRRAPAVQWLTVLDAAGVPCGPISDVAEALGSEQARVRRVVVDAGGVAVPGNPVKTSAWPEEATRPAAPELDQHGAALRRELG
ncbi:MAG: CoA:oxalate CoA-transferase [Actinomycetota bacterium]|jgi:CoA:oxalate CoA-transferase|nr:CoA:oxalate CoA-transferase [Actinomycetota bacterium]